MVKEFSLWPKVLLKHCLKLVPHILKRIDLILPLRHEHFCSKSRETVWFLMFLRILIGAISKQIHIKITSSGQFWFQSYLHLWVCHINEPILRVIRPVVLATLKLHIWTVVGCTIYLLRAHVGSILLLQVLNDILVEHLSVLIPLVHVVVLVVVWHLCAFQ